MKVSIFKARSFKIKDTWHFNISCTHDGLSAPGIIAIAKKLENFLDIKFDKDYTDMLAINAFYYTPKDDVEEAQFIMKFSAVENMEFDL